MSNKIFLSASFLFFTLLLCVEPALSSPLTLKECYELALKQSEQIAIQEAVIKEAEGRFLQSFSGMLPDISFEITEQIQDTTGAPASIRKRTPQRKFTFSQPLFSGFKEFAAMAASRAEKRQRLHEKRRAEELLFIDVVDAFYLFLTYQDDVDTLSTIYQALSERVKELKERQKLGRSRASEVASAQARLSRSEADLEEVKGQWEVTRQLLEFLTGQPIAEILDEEIKYDIDMPQEKYLTKAQNRSDVKAAFESWQVAKKEVTVARGNFLPEVTADGNYYDKRVGTSENVDWDVLFTVNIPLFAGGENMGLFKEAKAQALQEEKLYEETKRKADLNIKNTYTNFNVSSRRQKAFEQAYMASEENYKLQMEDYQKNLVNNLDVLQALEDVQDMRRSWTLVKNNTKRFYWNFIVSTGDLHDHFRLSD